MQLPSIDLLNLWKPILEITILWFVLYHIILFLVGTRAFQVLIGISIIIIAFLLFQRLGLETLNWLLTKLFAISVIAILIIFQPEIRRGLANLGKRRIFGIFFREAEFGEILREVSDSVEILSQKRIGALIAIERNERLTRYIETGIKLDSRVNKELILSIFSPLAPLHDGGIVIQQTRITAAGCLFPLTEREDLSRTFGMRHRAAIGLTEETDAVVVVVSEETGDISLCSEGNIRQGFDREKLNREMKNLLKRKV